MTIRSTLARGAARSPDAIVVGDGLVGLCCALAIADASREVLLIGAELPGQASSASAGMLAPSVERGWGAAHRVGLIARDGYPHFVGALEARTGIGVPLDRSGILQVALDDSGAAGLRAGAASGSFWLDAEDLTQLEPALAHASGAVLHPDDGAVDNRQLLRALRAAVREHASIERLDLEAGPALELLLDAEGPTVRTRGRTIATGHLVLAAGAWSSTIQGIPRRLPLEPIRGQMIAFDTSPLGRVVYGPAGYLVPRAGCTWAGSTMERVGFASDTTSEGLGVIRSAATAICPSLRDVGEIERWAGLRPVTPDFLPIIGVEPAYPALIYACGHSRNGVLLAPLTGQCVGALATGEEPPVDLSAFLPTRFDGQRDR